MSSKEKSSFIHISKLKAMQIKLSQVNALNAKLKKQIQELSDDNMVVSLNYFK